MVAAVAVAAAEAAVASARTGAGPGLEPEPLAGAMVGRTAIVGRYNRPAKPHSHVWILGIVTAEMRKIKTLPATRKALIVRSCQHRTASCGSGAVGYTL